MVTRHPSIERPAVERGSSAGDGRASPFETAARDLPSALRLLVASAAEQRSVQLPANPEKPAGYVEGLAQGQDGLLWIFGWMRNGTAFHAPAVVVANGTDHPSAMAVATYPRGDLPKDASGFVGLLKTDWRPADDGSARTPLLFIVGEADADACLPFANKLKLFTAEDCAGRVAALKPVLAGPFAKPLLRMFGSVSNWALDSARVSGARVKASADRIVVVPGFGCLVEGWVFSPFRAIEGFMLRAGKAVLAADPGTIGRKPRPDLLSLASNAQRMAEAAGFVAAFPGHIDEQDSNEVVLKVVCDDGLSTNHAVGADAVRVLGASARLEEVLQLFPAVRDEAFFPELARCISEETRRRASGATAFEVRAAEAVLAVAVPDDGRDMALLFDELTLAAERRGRRSPPVVALARPGQHRSAVLSLFGDLRRNVAAASSLFFVPDPDHAIHALDQVLARVGASRFAFVGPGVFPTESGWDALLDRLEAGEDEPAFVPVQTPAGGAVPTGAAQRPECFAWNRRALADWLARTPAFLSGSSGEALTLPAGAVPASPSASAKRGRRAPPSVLATWINERLCQGLAEVPHA